MPEQAAPVRITARRAAADEWALVLAAEGLSPQVQAGPTGWELRVPAGETARAAALLADYERENRRAPAAASPPVWRGQAPLLTALASVSALLVFFLVTGPAGGSPWFEAGAASRRILAGEPWRAVTALCLHADAAHALANALAGALFLGLAFRALGPGLGAALVLAAGGLGNLLNAALQAPGHVSLGASTAVFGAVGLLGGLSALRRGGRTPRRRRPWMVVAASLALLGLLGTGGERTDIWAHALGLLCGGALGVASRLVLQRPPGPAAQLAWGGLALAALLGAWQLARVPSL